MREIAFHDNPMLGFLVFYLATLPESVVPLQLDSFSLHMKECPKKLPI